MPLKLGNNDINKAYLGNTEVKKAYLGNNLIFDNSIVIPYYLALNSVNQDHCVIPTSIGVFNSSDLTGSPFYFFEFGCVLRSLPISTNQGFIGNYNSNSNIDRLGLTISNVGSGRVTLFHGGSNLFINNVLTDIIDSYTIIRCEFTQINASSYTAEVFFNGVSKGIGTVNAFTGSNINEYAWLGGRGNLQNDPTILNSSDVDIYYLNYNGNLFNINEGSGFDTVSSEGDIFTGVTSNAGGLTYWNNNVWQLV